MAKGWESKGVEEQMADRENAVHNREHSKVGAQLAHADKLRARQALELQREQILNQKTSNAHRRMALAAALEQIEQQLAALAAQG